MNTKINTIRVLIVDDSPQVRRDLRAILPLAISEDGRAIQVVGEAENGRDAIVLIRTIHPDVVLLDLAMPVLDGWSAAQEIKAENPDIRVVALSIHNNEGSRTRARQSGVDDFVVKGASLREIIQAIAS